MLRRFLHSREGLVGLLLLLPILLIGLLAPLLSPGDPQAMAGVRPIPKKRKPGRHGGRPGCMSCLSKPPPGGDRFRCGFRLNDQRADDVVVLEQHCECLSKEIHSNPCVWRQRNSFKASDLASPGILWSRIFQNKQ